MKDSDQPRSNWETFWTLFRESTVIQAVITGMICLTVCGLVIRGMPIPDSLDRSMILILGFYFGTKSNAAARTATAEAHTNIATVVEAMNKK